MSSETQSVTIVMVEDDPGHAVLIEKNLRRAGIVNTILSLKDGGEAAEFLFGDGSATLRNRPLLIMLDLNLPVLDGYQLLQRIKKDERTRHIPVVILTTTDNPREVQRCYDLGCNVYVTKPVEYEHFTEAVRKLGMFLSIVQVPGAEAKNG